MVLDKHTRLSSADFEFSWLQMFLSPLVFLRDFMYIQVFRHFIFSVIGKYMSVRLNFVNHTI